MKKNTKILASVILMALAMVIVAGIRLNQPAYAFMMDVNPSIEIKANRLDKVVEINPLNEDAKNLLKDFKLHDRALDKTIEDLADLMVLKGYISGGKDNFVMITVNDHRADERIVNELNKTIAAYLENKQIEATIANQSILGASEVNQNKSGKEIVINKIKDLDDDATVEELSKMSLIQLITYAEDRGINPDKLFNTIRKSIRTEEKENIKVKKEVVKAENKIEKEIVKLQKEESKVENKSSKSRVTKQSIISIEDAKKIALGAINGTILKVELDDDDDHDDRSEYKIDIVANGRKYEIELDALSGKVLEIEADDDDDYIEDINKKDSKSSVSDRMISAEQAKEIALELVNGRIVEFELDNDDDDYDDAKYKIDIVANGRKYEIEIDAFTAKVEKFELDDDDDYDEDEDEDDYHYNDDDDEDDRDDD